MMLREAGSVKGLVSILIVTYNAQGFIRSTVASCLDQSYRNIELLVLDNNSTDRTLALLEDLADERVRLFRNDENTGAYAGLNHLLAKARGEFIAIQDHDDIWFPNKIERQVSWMDTHQECIACGTTNFSYYESIDLVVQNARPFAATGNNYVPHSSLLFRNHGYRYDTSKTLADEHFEKSVLAKAGSIALIQAALTVHRIRKDGRNLSSSRFRLSWPAISEFFEINRPSIKSMIYLCALVLSGVLSENTRIFFECTVGKRTCPRYSLLDFRKSHAAVSRYLC